ncbi:hypothetical protein APHAL10511_007106 [Amanita phalloides]|nr:hypothetical protein APHAL10511_007106 [Amanita phalloides]
MDLYLVPDNPEHTILVSCNGVAHYKIRTVGRPKVSILQRPADCEEESIVAEIEWRHWDSPSKIRSPLFGMHVAGVLLDSFLFRKRRFGHSRYFVGNDGLEYKWKLEKGLGLVLTQVDTLKEIAHYSRGFVEEGLFAHEKRAMLRIQPSSLDIDLIILSFLIFAKKRRDRGGDGTKLTAHDDDPQGDGGFSGAEVGDT